MSSSERKRKRGTEDAPAAKPANPAKAVGGAGVGGSRKPEVAKRKKVVYDDDDDDDDASSSSPWSPIIFVKVGDGGKYVDWAESEWDVVKDLLAGGLLKAVKADDIFEGYFEGVKRLGDCTVLIRKGELPDSKDEPPAGEKDSKFVELKGAKAVGDAAVEGECKGERLFIFVRLPGAGAAGPSAGSGAWRFTCSAWVVGRVASHLLGPPNPASMRACIETLALARLRPLGQPVCISAPCVPHSH